MKVKKKFNVVLSAIFMMGLGMGIASCSDDNKNMSDNPGSGDDNKTEAQYEQESTNRRCRDGRLSPS